MPRPLRTLIYGSCVARDVVRVVPEPFELVRYVARQSWVSAYWPASTVPDVSHLQSAFQRRAISGDFGSTAPRLLRRLSSQVDLVLIDIASDRHGVMRIGRGFVSLTPDHRRAFDGPFAPDGEFIPFGTDQHLALFTEAATRAAASLQSEGTLGRAVVLAFPFTDRLDTGGAVAKEKVAVSTLNALYQPYYSALAERGFHILRLPQELAVSTADHTWGPGVDHFADPAPVWWASQLLASGVAREHADT